MLAKTVAQLNGDQHEVIGGDSRFNWVRRFLIHVAMPKAARQMEKGARTGAILVKTEQGVM